MNRSVELPESDYARLEEAAAAEGVTPAAWIRERLPQPSVTPCSNGKPAKSLADLFEGQIGRFSSGTGEPRSDDLRESFGAYLEQQHRAGRL
jgi:hypothetical protein